MKNVLQNPNLSNGFFNIKYVKNDFNEVMFYDIAIEAYNLTLK